MRIARFAPLAAALAIAATTLTPAVAQQNAADAMHQKMMSAPYVTVPIVAQNGSGQVGTARLTQLDGNVNVVVLLAGVPQDVVEAIHIHKGPCATLDPKPMYPLSNVERGVSQTVVKNVKLSDLTSGNFAINIHDAKDLSHYVACGDIK